MDHSFNIEIAKSVGVAGAVLLNNIYWWVDKNAKNQKNFFEGKYWTYNKKSAYLEQFPYLTENQLEYALTKLRDAGYIEVGNFNASKYDRTLWYTLTEKAYKELQNYSIHSGNFGNGETKNTAPIQDINKDINKDTDIVEQSSTIPYSDIIDYLNSKAETNFKSNSDSSKTGIRARWKEGYRLENFFSVIDVKVAEWKNDKKMAQYLRPSTLFGTKFESYLQQAHKEKTDKKEAVSVPVSKEDKAKNPDGSYVTF